MPPVTEQAAGAIQTTLGTPTLPAILFFLIIVAITLAITYWAAKRTKTTKEFYAAGRSVSAFQNGLALSGDYMSAASFLGIAEMVGSGSLIKLMFGIPYEYAEIMVGAIMLAYVLFGGMLATTWVQIIKAVMLLCGVTVMMLMVLAKFNFNPG